MKKFLLASLFLVIVSLLSAKAFISLFGYQMIENLQAKLETEAAITYSWMSSDFSGEIHFHDLSVTPFRLKQSYHAETLSIDYGNLPSLIFGLLDLKHGVWKGIDTLKIHQGRAPIKGRGLIPWLANEYDPAFLVPLHAFACNHEGQFGIEEWQGMGLEEFRFDMELSFQHNNGDLLSEAKINLNELGQFNLSLKADDLSVPVYLDQLSPTNIATKELNITHIEKGFFRRLSNFCSTRTQSKPTEYSQHAALAWRKAMQDIGLFVNDAIAHLYRDYLNYGGKIDIKIAPEKALKLESAEQWLDQSLSARLGLSLTLNDKELKQPAVFLRGDYYRPPPVIEEKAPEKPKVIAKRFRPIEWDQLTVTSDAKQKLRVHLDNGKVVEGTLEAKDLFRISVGQMLEGGSFSVHLKKSDIELIEVWR